MSHKRKYKISHVGGATR